ncbi:MAG: S8 family serine peptidase [Muribaculaceae bacterium]|nr:S8 family serine peptidase [Muribaculaceae bacterium]
MNKHKILFAMLTTAVCATAAETDISLKLHLSAQPTHRAESPYLPMVLDIEEGSEIADMESQGIKIWYRRGDMALAAVPRDLLINPAGMAGIRKASLGGLSHPLLDKAVPDTRADKVLDGLDALPRPFDGAGVLVGLSDIGFDATHPAFAGRIAGFSRYDLAENSHVDLLATGEITDCASETHATHVCGIMAGNDLSVPYRGVARGSVIYATTSEALYDANILCGVEEIISYGREHDMPVVINLSLGTTLGPHDGSSAMARYLDLCSEDACILLSAGNDGNSSVSAHKRFSDDDTSVSLGFTSTQYDDLMKLSGSADIWGDTGKPVRLRLKIWNLYDERYMYSSDWIDFESLPDGILSIDFEKHPDLKQFFKGTLLAAGQTDPVNGRYNIGMNVNLTSLLKHPDGAYSNVRPVIELSSLPGSDVWAYTAGKMIFSGRSYLGGIISGSPERSISDMATGFHTVSVGSATTRVTAPAINGGQYDWAGFVTLDEVSKFSSYGTLDDGRRLPHFCAPGAYIVSAANSAWVSSGHAVNLVPTESTGPYMAECGTSMASPHAAGIMALWLEANPQLTPQQLRQIAVETAVERGVDRNDPRTGAGLIDALDGVRRALNFQGVHSPEAGLARIYRRDGRLVIEGVDDTASVSVHDLFGRPVNADALPPAPVIVRLTTASSTVVRKI